MFFFFFLFYFRYNETFHPRSTLKKLIGEKNNQGVLQKLHVLAASLNNYESITMDDVDSEFVITRNKIRQGFFEVLNNLQISSKVSLKCFAHLHVTLLLKE